MSEWIHDFDLCFSIENDDPDPDNITGEQLKEAAIARIKGIPDNEWREACGHVYTDEI